MAWLTANDVYHQFPLLKAQLEGTATIANHLSFGEDIVNGYLNRYGGVHATDDDFGLKLRAGCFFAIFNWSHKKEDWDIGMQLIKAILMGITGTAPSGQTAGSDAQIYGTNEYDSTDGDSKGVLG